MCKLDKLYSTAACAVFALFLSALPAAAQNTAPVSGPDEPAETEIILPEMYLEIEDLSIEEINAVIPDNDSVFLSALELKLPDPDQINIPAEAFAVSSLYSPLTSSVFNTSQDGSAFFSEGTIGIGTSANITGDINLYHIGEQPDFRLRYFHDGYDGFSTHTAGEGYSSREELIEAELNYSGDDLSADLVLSYNEIENGLQDNTDYFSLTRRIPELSSAIDWSIRDNILLTGSLNAYAAGFQLNSVNPLAPGYSIFSIAPETGIIFGRETLNLGLMLNYYTGGQINSNDIMQDLGGSLVFTAEISELFRLSGDAGILWDNYGQLYYPFSLEISGSGAMIDYSLSGGYIADYEDRTDLWDIYPTAAGPQSLDSLGSIPITHGWIAEALVKWNVTGSVSLRASTEFSMLDNALKPGGSDLSGFNSVSAVESTCLSAGLGIYLKILDNLSFDLAWDGQLLDDIDWYKPVHLFSSETELTCADRDMGLIGTMDFRVYDTRQTWFSNDWLPLIGLEGYLRLAEGFVLSVSGQDLAAVFLDSGRNIWNGYIDKGAVLQAKIKISL
jgi:hypothetical protein